MITRILTATLLIAITLPNLSLASEEEIVVYSARKEHLIKPLFDTYTKETGTPIKYITGKAGALLERIKAEGKNTPADLLITVDAGNLWQAAEEGILEPVESKILAENVPTNLRDPENKWFGLSVRARTIVYNTENVSKTDLQGYADLATERWKKQLILRTSKKVYNQSLVASLIAEHGQDQARNIVQGWVDNLAVAPFSNDTKALEAVAAGLGKATIVNTYYFGRLMKEKPELPLAIFWPDQETTGVHMNVSGAGVVKGAGNKEGAVRLLEWLTQGNAQQQFAAVNMEYPVNPTVDVSPIVSKWGTFKGSDLNVAVYGKLQAEAIKLMDTVGYK